MTNMEWFLRYDLNVSRRFYLPLSMTTGINLIVRKYESVDTCEQHVRLELLTSDHFANSTGTMFTKLDRRTHDTRFTRQSRV
jgi:hypothetical protein